MKWIVPILMAVVLNQMVNVIVQSENIRSQSIEVEVVQR
jgi:hypothetical protein